MTPEEKYEEVKSWFEGVVNHGDYFMAYCPSHDNHNTRALSVVKYDDGVGFDCKGNAGCTTDSICAAVGKKSSDLFTNSSSNVMPLTVKSGGKDGCTLEAYAEAKQLPVEFLQETIGLYEHKRYAKTKAPALVMPYFDEHSEEIRIRYRIALAKADGRDNRFVWRSGSKADTLYGLEQLPDIRKYKQPVILVEGESDVHTLRYFGYAALGIPGASNFKAVRPELFEGVEQIYVIEEPDEAGEGLAENIEKQLHNIDATISFVRMSEDEGDPSDVYLADRENFRERFDRMLANAESYAEREHRDENKRRAELWEKCKELARCPCILTEFVEDFRRAGVVGQDKEAQIVFLAGVSRLLSSPSSVALKGPSSGGKSYTLNKVLEFLPESGYYKLSALSDKALAHFDEPLSHRHLVISEATALDNSDMASYLLRTLLSEKELTYAFPTATDDGVKMQHKHIEGPTGLFMTTTQHSLHAENETRFISITVNDTRQHTRSVISEIATKNGYTPNMERWHALQEVLEIDKESDVFIPYAQWIAHTIPEEALHVRLRRDFTHLLNFIKAHALLHRENRERNGSGYLVATCEDYRIVRALLYDVFAEALEASVSPTVRETVNGVRGLYDRLENKSDGVTVNALKAELHLERSVTQRRTQNALRRGFITNLEDKRGRPARYAPADPLPNDVTVLPEVNELIDAGVCPCGHCVKAEQDEETIPPQSSEEDEQMRKEIRMQMLIDEGMSEDWAHDAVFGPQEGDEVTWFD